MWVNYQSLKLYSRNQKKKKPILVPLQDYIVVNEVVNNKAKKKKKSIYIYIYINKKNKIKNLKGEEDKVPKYVKDSSVKGSSKVILKVCG